MTKTALVTGGSRGIGAATATRLAGDGYRVLLTYRDAADAAERTVATIKQTGGDAHAVKVDASLRGEVAMLATHPWVLEGVDALVLNHGIYARETVSTLSTQTARKTFEGNFFGVLNVWELVSVNLNPKARVVVLGSQLGVKGTAHGGDYSASKGALHAWARSLAQDLASQDIRVNVVAPGTIETDLVASDSPEKRQERNKSIPMQRLGHPNEVASAISFLVGPDSSYMTGAVVHVNGGLFLP